MGFEYRIRTAPAITSLDSICDEFIKRRIFRRRNWVRIPAIYLGKDGVGVQRGAKPENPSWPNFADFCLEEEGTMYFISHASSKCPALNDLLNALRAHGFALEVEEI